MLIFYILFAWLYSKLGTAGKCKGANNNEERATKNFFLFTLRLTEHPPSVKVLYVLLLNFFKFMFPSSLNPK